MKFNKFDKVIDGYGKVCCVVTEVPGFIDKVVTVDGLGHIHEQYSRELTLLTPELEETIRKAKGIALETETYLDTVVCGGNQ